MTPGGEEPPILVGEKSPLSKFSNELILSLQLDLINTNISYSELSKKYGIDTTYITKINSGETRNNSKFTYPLRKTNNIIKSENFIREIVNKLLYTTISIEQLAKDFKIDSSTIYRINLGRQQNCPKEIEYPIRNKGERISKKMLPNIIIDLLDNKLKFKEIEKNTIFQKLLLIELIKENSIKEIILIIL